MKLQLLKEVWLNILKRPLSRKIKLAFILLIYFLIPILGNKTPPISLLLIHKEMCGNLYSEDFIQKLKTLFFSTHLSMFYRPLLYVFECYFLIPLSYSFPSIYKLVYGVAYTITGITLHLFLKTFLRNASQLSLRILFFFSIILPAFEDPLLKVNLPLIMGASLIFFSGYIYLSDKKLKDIIYIITAFFSAFISELSRVYTLPFLIVLFFIYGGDKKKKYFIMSVTFFTICSLIPHIKSFRFTFSHHLLLLHSLYDLERIIEAHIFSLGYFSSFLIITYFVLYLNKIKSIFSHILWVFAFIITFFIPPPPYVGIISTIFIGNKIWFILLFLGYFLSSILIITKSPSTEEKTAGILQLLFPLLYWFVMEFFTPLKFVSFPRYFLPAYPFLLFISLLHINFLIKNKGGKVLCSFILFSFLYHNLSSSYLLIIKNKAMDKIIKITRSQMMAIRKNVQKTNAFTCLFFSETPDIGVLNFYYFMHPYNKEKLLAIHTIFPQDMYFLIKGKGKEKFSNKCEERYFFFFDEDISEVPYQVFNKNDIEKLAKEGDFGTWFSSFLRTEELHNLDFLPGSVLFFNYGVEYEFLPIFESELIFKLIFQKTIFQKGVLSLKIFKF
jgi:hypothetical protein